MKLKKPRLGPVLHVLFIVMGTIAWFFLLLKIYSPNQP